MKRASGLTENLGIKFVALLLALALYAHVVTEQPVEQVLYFPVQVEGLADSLALHSPAPQELGVKVRGTGKQIIRLRIVRPPMTLDLAGVAAGQFQRAFTPADFKGVSQEGVEVVGPVQPASIQLQLEPRASAEVPVAIRYKGGPARGYLVSGRPRIQPERVKISGPRTWVRSRDSLETEPIVLAGRRGNLELLQPLVTPPTWATVQPGSVLVAMSIDAQVSGARDLAPEAKGLRPGFTAQLDPPRVRVQWVGPRAAAPEATKDLRASVEVGRRGRGRFVIPVRLAGRGAAFVQSVRPESVSVVVQ